MKISVLTENTSKKAEYSSEHGLSLYIETEKHKILFDMGQSNIFKDNAEKMGIDLSKADIAVLSHGHYDHGGGLKSFLEINQTARIYINKNAFEEYYAEDGRYLGLDNNLSSWEQIIFTEDNHKIDSELSLFTGNTLPRPFIMDTFGLFVKREGKLIPDNFLHEQYLVISENNKKILISGCSHKGILNIMHWVAEENICAVFGGFHYMKLDTEKDYNYLCTAAKQLLNTGAKFYTCHCTGISQYNIMKDYMNDKLDYISVGDVIEI